MKYQINNKYWVREFSAETPVVRLNRKQVSTGRKSTVTVEIPLSVREKRMQIAEGNPMGRFIYDLSCFILLLKIYSAEKIISITTPYLKSDLSGTGKLCLIKSDLSGDLTCKEALNQIRLKVKEIFEQPKLDVDQLMGVSSHHLTDLAALLQIGFCYEELQERSHISSDLFMTIRKDLISIEFDEAYQKPFVEQLAEHYLVLLDRTIDDLDKKVHELDVLSVEEKNHLIHDFNRTERMVPDHRGFNSLFEKSVANYPDKIAVEFESKKLSYTDLDKRANNVAHALEEQEVCKGDIVVVLMDRSDSLLASILGIWKIGAVYLPLDPLLPPSRINEIMLDSKAKHVLVEFKHIHLLSEESQAVNKIIYDSILSATENKMISLRKLNLDDIAYVIYTSGSSGRPKGVVIEHLGMINHLYAKVNDFNLSDKSILAQNASQAFDISIWQMLAALLVGGKVIVYGKNCVMDMVQFVRQIADNQVNVLQLVPSYLATLIDSFEPEELQTYLSEVRHLIVTGEEYKVALAQKAYEILPETLIVNAYGPTEASDDVTHYFLDGDFQYDSLPIGKPLQNINIYVVDERMNLCPIGVKGEICVSGISVGKGYLNNDKKTEAVFKKDPFVSERGKMYMTRDLGSYLPDGNIQFFGRKDDQIKINGNRVELSDIEQNLAKNAEVKEVAVLLKDADSTSPYLCAYISLKEGETASEESIKSTLAKFVPSYMIPSEFIFQDEMPHLPNGKVDRVRLKMMRSHKQKEAIDASTVLEKKLIAIWSEVLNHKVLSVTDNFFDLGGNSLIAMQMTLKVNQMFNTELEIQDVFDYPTIKKLAHTLEQMQEIEEEVVNPSSERDLFEI